MNKFARESPLLALLCLICGLAIVLTHALLGPRIARQQLAATQAGYLRILHIEPAPDVQLDSKPVTDDAALLGLRSPQTIYVARRDGRVLGVVLPVTAHEGYAGDIDLLLGIDPQGKVISVQVTSEHETRDLGDKIEPRQSDWLAQFRGHSDANQTIWRLRGEGGAFDGITGATVTSRAVIEAVRQGLTYFEEHRDEIIGKQKP